MHDRRQIESRIREQSLPKRHHVDALVTYMGTAGIEFAALGKPVLLADRGWYHDCGFAVWSKTRNDYLAQLGTTWWNSHDGGAAARRAEIFAGWYFGHPAWQSGFLLLDDANQARLYAAMPTLLKEHGEEVDREIELLRTWFDTHDRMYHTYKMREALIE